MNERMVCKRCGACACEECFAGGKCRVCGNREREYPDYEGEEQ